MLYWSPMVSTGQQHFFSSDLPGKYIVVAEGLDADGKAGTGMTSFEVTGKAR